MKLIKSVLFILLGFVGFVTYSQVQTDTFYVSKDAYVNSGFTSTNYGSDTLLQVYADTGATVQAYRSYLHFDVSSIPSNAIIVSAKLRLTPYSVVDSVSHPIYISRLDTNVWTEGGVNWSNKPGIWTSDQYSFTHVQTQNTTLQEFNITNIIQNHVYYPWMNYGLEIKLQDETQSNDCGIIYYSSEHDTVQWRPSLEVKYIFSGEVSGYVSHCSNGNNDGEIDVSFSGGSGTYYSYWWYKHTGTLGLIETSTTVNQSTIDVDGLSPGLYLLVLRDNLYYTVGSDTKYNYYRWFLVGEEGDTTNVSFYYSDAYCSDVVISRNKDTRSNPPNYEDVNFDSYVWLNVATAPALAGSCYDMASLIKYDFDFDPTLDFQKSELVLNRWTAFYHTSISTNAYYARNVTEYWNEKAVTWNTRPSVDSSLSVFVPQTEPSGYVYWTDTIQIDPFVEFWQQNPDENFGIELGHIDNNEPAAALRQLRSSYYGVSGHVLSLRFTVKPTIETVYYDSLGLGDIVVNAPAGELPYTYLISYDTLPDFDSIWYHVKDSIPVDSTTFYRGRSNTRNYTFTQLPGDHYYVGVYDNQGEMLLMREVYLSPDIVIYDSTDLDVDGDTLKVKSGETEAMATLYAVLSRDQAGGIEIEVVSLADDLQIGTDAVDDSFPVYSRDFVHSLLISTTGKVYAMRSDSILDSTTVILGDKLALNKDLFDAIHFLKNGDEFAGDTLSDTLTSDLKFQVYLKGASSKALIKGLSKGAKKPVVKYSITHLDCGDSQGSVTISVPAYSYFGFSFDHYTIYDSNGDPVASGSTSGSVPLAAGTYTITSYYSVGLFGMTSYTQVFRIGYWVMWVPPLTNFIESVSPYHSLSVDNGSLLADGFSLNQASQVEDNWIQFGTKQTGSVPISVEWVYLENSTGDHTFKLMLVELYPTVLIRQAYVYNESDVLQASFPASMNPLFIMQEDDGTVKIYQDNILKSSFGSGVSGKLSIHAEAIGQVEFVDFLASFCYPKSDYIAKTKPYTDGSYFITVNNEIRFQYTGEYNQSDLIYDLVDESGTVVSTSNYSINVTGGSGYLKKNADNRYTLDMQSLPGGFYLLVVTNVKGEKHYLRIKN